MKIIKPNNQIPFLRQVIWALCLQKINKGKYEQYFKTKNYRSL